MFIYNFIPSLHTFSRSCFVLAKFSYKALVYILIYTLVLSPLCPAFGARRVGGGAEADEGRPLTSLSVPLMTPRSDSSHETAPDDLYFEVPPDGDMATEVTAEAAAQRHRRDKAAARQEELRRMERQGAGSGNPTELAFLPSVSSHRNAGKAASSPPSEGPLQGTYTFRERRTPETTIEGDCGFDALGITRVAAVQQLLAHSADQAIREILWPEIGENFMEGEIPNFRKSAERLFPAPLVEELMGLLTARSRLSGDQHSDELQALDVQLQTFYSRQDVFESYIRSYYGREGWLTFLPNYARLSRPSSTLDALAKINEFNCYVWQRTGHNELTLRHIVLSGKAESSDKHLFHTTAQGSVGGERNHFTRLSVAGHEQNAGTLSGRLEAVQSAFGAASSSSTDGFSQPPLEQSPPSAMLSFSPPSAASRKSFDSRRLSSRSVLATDSSEAPIEAPFLERVTTLDLSNNDLSEASEPLILRMVESYPNITAIDVSGNSLSERFVTQLNARLQENAQKARQQPVVTNVEESWFENLDNTAYVRPESAPVRHVLSLQGGGMRGLILATFLKEMERRIHALYGSKKRIQDVVDGVAGSSIGGIIALGLVKQNPISPDKLVKLFTTHGKSIFGKPGSRLFRARYAAEPLEKVLQEYFGNETLADIPKDKLALVTAVRTDGPKGLEPYVFDSGTARESPIHNFDLSGVGVATAAAPTVFPRAAIRDHSDARNSYGFWDGGFWRNDPSELALNRMIRRYPGDRIKVLSFGTGEALPNYKPIWTDGLFGNLSPLLFGQMDLSANVVQIMQERLGDDYVRLQPLLWDGNRPLQADLDTTDDRVLKLYQTLARSKWKSADMDDVIRRMCEERQ